MTILELFRKIKTEYGINQTMLARKIGVSPQILTDVKAGRRRFTVSMAEAIMEEFSGLRDAGWVAEALTGILSSGLHAAAEANKGISTALTPATSDAATIRLPVLNALCKAEPLKAPGNVGKTAPIPEALVPFLVEGSDSYVLILDYDDCSGRLRAGDQVLIVQKYPFPKEIMAVECAGRLRLARNPICSDGHGGKGAQWLALETGTPLENVTLVGAVVGIVVAVL